MREIRAVILAAGKGTRMKSGLSKMVHDIMGKPVVEYVADACRNVGIETIYVIVGSGAEQVKKALGSDYQYVLQEPQLGTGHALMQVCPLLENYRGDLLVLVGDSPFITPDVLNKLITKHRASDAASTFITAIFEQPPPYGRIVRDNNGKVLKIIEEKDATPQEKAIKEVNTAHYCFKAEIVLPLLSEISNDNVKQEYYLTDIVEILTNNNHSVETLQETDSRLVFGINNRMDMAEAFKIFRQQILSDFMQAGVTIVDPATTYIDSKVTIGPDTIIYPFTYIQQNTVIGKNCRIGPFVYIMNSEIKENSELSFTVIRNPETSGQQPHSNPALRDRDEEHED